MIWAHSDKTAVGEQKLFYRKGKWILVEKSNDGFVELESYVPKQRNIISKEIETYNAELRNRGRIESIRESSLQYRNIRDGYSRNSGNVVEQQSGNGQSGTLYRGKSESDGSGDYQSGESGNRTVKDDGSRSALKKGEKEYREKVKPRRMRE